MGIFDRVEEITLGIEYCTDLMLELVSVGLNRK